MSYNFSRRYLKSTRGTNIQTESAHRKQIYIGYFKVHALLISYRKEIKLISMEEKSQIRLYSDFTLHFHLHCDSLIKSWICPLIPDSSQKDEEINPDVRIQPWYAILIRGYKVLHFWFIILTFTYWTRLALNIEEPVLQYKLLVCPSFISFPPMYLFR